MKRIAIVGPDGSGKSTLCASLQAAIPNSCVRYAGKNREHLLKITPIALSFMNRAQIKSAFLGSIVKHLFFYPVEYIENRLRFSPKDPNDIYITIYDRHPIDRSIARQYLHLKKNQRQISLIRYFLKIPTALFWDTIYRRFFPRIDCLFVLLPSAEIIFYRSMGQYKTFLNAETRIKAYRKASELWAIRQKVIPFEIDKSTTVEYLTCHICDFLKTKTRRE